MNGVGEAPFGFDSIQSDSAQLSFDLIRFGVQAESVRFGSVPIRVDSARSARVEFPSTLCEYFLNISSLVFLSISFFILLALFLVEAMDLKLGPFAKHAEYLRKYHRHGAQPHGAIKVLSVCGNLEVCRAVHLGSAVFLIIVVVSRGTNPVGSNSFEPRVV